MKDTNVYLRPFIDELGLSCQEEVDGFDAATNDDEPRYVKMCTNILWIVRKKYIKKSLLMAHVHIVCAVVIIKNYAKNNVQVLW